MRSGSVIMAACAASIAVPASAELVDAPSGAFVSRHAAVVAADPATTWDALIVPADWWSDAHTFSGDAQNYTLDPRAGGCLCEMLPSGEDRAAPGSVQHMTVLLADPGRAMRLSGGLGPLQSEPVGAVLTITLKPVDEGTRVLFEYIVGGAMRYDRDQIAPAVDRVIGEQLAGLADHLGRPGAARQGLGLEFLGDLDARADAAPDEGAEAPAVDLGPPPPPDDDAEPIATDETYSR